MLNYSIRGFKSMNKKEKKKELYEMIRELYYNKVISRDSRRSF
ncbi:unnamed protein product [marine sediment metagenome]|uniref:Uncharacterized protein n=1 Tax=marine sediment metagenome TaxID=412755 RepID=X1CXD8_9ZZZZ